MTKISPAAQAIIDRLARMDPANPRHDKEAIERAITAHLAALGLPARPFVWADDARAWYRFVAGQVQANVTWDPRWDAAWRTAHNAAWDQADAWKVARDAVLEADWIVGWNGLWEAALSAREEFGGAYWRPHEGARGHAWVAAWEALSAALCSYTGDDGLVLFDPPVMAGFADLWSAMMEAYEAGLFLYWITTQEVVCALQPSLRMENGNLHYASGPAVVWPSGEAYHFWRGSRVPAWIIEEKHRITAEAIRAESNQEVRRCMVEIYGRSRYLRDTGARLVHEDEFGRLWEAEGREGERWRFVEVENGTPEDDGTRRAYTLDVTDAAEVLGWPIETARAAVAATYGLRPEEYHPEIRT